MSISKVYFASRELAESLIGKPSIAVISITDPGSPPANLHAHFEHILRLAFFDAVPADEFLPAPLPGMFDYRMARQIASFVHDLQQLPDKISVLVHCEYGVSRSAAVALFVEAYSGAPLISREFTGEANQWVIDQLLQMRPELEIDIPPVSAAQDRRTRPRL
jgi:protein-tyrosine phosphatase